MASHIHSKFENQDRAVGKEMECSECQRVFQLLSNVELYLTQIEERLAAVTENAPAVNSTRREYYGVAEFAKLVGKSEYTVREWCRLFRIKAEKCESGHGDYKAWKIPADELTRYRDHGLLKLPSRY